MGKTSVKQKNKRALYISSVQNSNLVATYQRHSSKKSPQTPSPNIPFLPINRSSTLFFVIDKKRIHLQYLFLKIKIKANMEQQNNTTNNSNTLMYLGIGAGILIVLLIAYLAWSSSSAKKEEEGSSSKDKSAQQKHGIKVTKAASYKAELKEVKKKITEDLDSMVVYNLNRFSFIQNYFYKKTIAVLLIHLGIGYCAQFKNNKKFPWPWHCLYFESKGNFKIYKGISIPRQALCTFVQIIVTLSCFVIFSGVLEDCGMVNLTIKQIKAKSGTQEIKLKDEAKGDKSQAFLTQCQTAKGGFEPIYKTAEKAFDKEKAVLDKKAVTIRSVEKLEKAISAAQEAKSTAANANEVKKQEDELAILNQELVYANAVAANNKIKKDKKATEQQKKEAAQKVKNAKDGLKTPEYKAAAAAFKVHKAHADFLQDAIDIMDTLIKKAKAKKQSTTQQQK